MKTRKAEMPWSHIYWLSMLSIAGSYTAAAKRLGVSKGAVSLRIAELEQITNIALVRRTTRSVHLTPAGQALVDDSRHAFEAIERGLDNILDLADVPRGVVRVTAPVAMGRQKIIPLIGTFLEAHPDVRIEIELSDHLSSMTQEGFDLAIRHTSSVPETHVAWLLQRSRTLLVATPTYLEKHGSPKTPADLTSHNCLYYLRSAALPAWSFVPVGHDTDRHSVAVRGNFCANNSEALRGVVMADQGIALLPDFSSLEDLTAGRLVHLLPDWKSVDVFGEAIYAVRPYSAYVPRPVRAFVEHLKNELQSKGTV